MIRLIIIAGLIVPLIAATSAGCAMAAIHHFHFGTEQTGILFAILSVAFLTLVCTAVRNLE